jgi:hypothetical protein
MAWRFLAISLTETPLGRLSLAVHRPVVLVCAIALLARIAVFFYLIAFPMANETGNLVSPMIFQLGSDYSFYFDSLRIYQGSFSDLFAHFIRTFDAPFTNLYEFVTSGPVLPILFMVFSYSAENTLPLSIATLAVGTITAWLWIVWLHRRDVRLFWLLVFAILPSPIWYQINNSLDTYHALFVALFVIAFLGGEANRDRVAMGLGAGTLATLAKPNGLPLMVFMLVDIVLHHSTIKFWLKVVFMLSASAIVAIFSLFYMTYLIAFLESSSHFKFFGVPYTRYLNGMYDALPAIIGLPLSWFSLIVAKILYLVGLRPSYGITPFDIVLIRSVPGLILLPGLLWLLFKRPRREALFVLIFLIPPFLGATQERYLLPIMPIVFYYSMVAFGALHEAVMGRHRYRGDTQATIDQEIATAVTGANEVEPKVGSTYRKPRNLGATESQQ